MFLLSFPLSLPFDWTLRCWVCVCCFVLFYFGYRVVCEKINKKLLITRSSEQLLVCYGGQQKGKAVSKQRLAHWIVDAIALAYQSQGEPCPMGVRAHSTRSVASSYALAHGASLADICKAAGWATPNTFARFYSLRVEPVSSRVLGNR